MAVSQPLKLLVLFFNLLFVIFGIILLGIGIWGDVKNNNYAKVEFVKEYEVTSGPRLLIAIAVIVIVISFCGCCGAYRESKCLLCSFVIALSVLLILEIAAAALAYKHKDEFKTELEKALKEKMNKYEPKKPAKDVEDLQEKLKCCGINSYLDWNNTLHYTRTGSVPDSCCVEVKKDCGKGKLNSPGKDIHKDGCISQLSKDYNKVLSATGGIAIAILVIQILGILFGVVLFFQVRNNQDTKEIK